jgi:hypothetical protein
MPARSSLLRDAISTNASQGIAPRNPRLLETNEWNIIHFPNLRGESVNNTVRSLLRYDNLLGSVMTDPTREEIKEAIGAAEARGETKIARFEGKLDLVLSKLDDVRQDNRTTRANQWVIAFGLALLIVAMVASFPAFFSIGSQIRDLVHTEVHDQLPARPSNQK